MSNDIYSFIKENFGIEITDYQFKRDYIKNPLKKTKLNALCYKLEYPEKEDIEYLFLTINLTREEITKLLGISKTSFTRFCRKHNIKKSIDLLEINAKKAIQNILEKNKNYYKNIKDKSKNTCKERYGVEYYSQTEKYKISFKNTCKERYGVENPSFLPEIIEKIKQTKNERYNNPYYNNIKKCKNTFKERYGVENPFQLPESIIKQKEGSYKKFGADCYLRSNLFKERCKNEEYKRKVLLKSIETKRKNGTLGKSISTKESLWLDSLNIPNDKEHRQVILYVDNNQYIVDGYNPVTNTVYEFFGDYWHGNPKVFIQENINYQKRKTFGELYQKTIEKINNLSKKFNVVYIWENDFNQGLSVSNTE